MRSAQPYLFEKHISRKDVFGELLFSRKVVCVGKLIGKIKPLYICNELIMLLFKFFE